MNMFKHVESMLFLPVLEGRLLHLHNFNIMQKVQGHQNPGNSDQEVKSSETPNNMVWLEYSFILNQ